MSNSDHDTGPASGEPSGPHDDHTGTNEREALVEGRRARQSARSGKTRKARLLVVTVLIGGAAVLLFALAGPSLALRLLGMVSDTDPRTSKVDMKVDRDANNAVHLDFAVPPPPEPPKPEADPNVIWKAKLKALQDQIAELESKKQQGPSQSEIESLITRYSDSLKQQFEQERKAMTEENARLKAAADQAEAARRKAEEDARTQSTDLKEREKLDKKQRESQSVVVDNAQAPAGGDPANPAADADLSPNARFLKNAAASTFQTSVSRPLPDPSRTIVQGTIISAVLETAIDTELPGSIRAHVMEPVYSFDGSRALMPAGTILIGEFNNDVNLEQQRVQIAWNRAITPSGQSIALGSIGTDVLGRSGTEGNVDNHYGTKIGAAVLTSVITALPSMLTSRSNDSGSSTTINVGTGGTSGNNQIAGQMTGAVSTQASGVLGKYLSLPPLIRIPQGEEIRVFTNRDLIFR